MLPKDICLWNEFGLWFSLVRWSISDKKYAASFAIGGRENLILGCWMMGQCLHVTVHCISDRQLPCGHPLHFSRPQSQFILRCLSGFPWDVLLVGWFVSLGLLIFWSISSPNTNQGLWLLLSLFDKSHGFFILLKTTNIHGQHPNFDKTKKEGTPPFDGSLGPHIWVRNQSVHWLWREYDTVTKCGSVSSFFREV